MKNTIDIETEDERILFERLASVRNDALESSMNEQEVARVFLMVAQGLLSPSFEQQDGTVTKEEKPVCPSCERVVYDFVVTGIGEKPILEDCGCRVHYEDIPNSLK